MKIQEKQKKLYQKPSEMLQKSTTFYIIKYQDISRVGWKGKALFVYHSDRLGDIHMQVDSYKGWDFNQELRIGKWQSKRRKYSTASMF